MNPLYKLVAILTIGFLSGWFVNGWRLGSKHTDELIQQQEAYLDQIEQFKVSLEESEKSREVLNKTILEKTDEINRLAHDVAVGTKRLSIHAVCPTETGPKANAGGTASTSVELDSSARPTYYALRSGIEHTESLLKFCRSELMTRSNIQK
jgi:hypothetical protein